MSTYLSLDLDFFNESGDDEASFVSVIDRHLEQVGQFVKARRVPCVAVMNHQQMLRFVNESGCTTLFNVDTHSDLADTGVEEFSCGTWVSYVKWRKNGHYRWRHAFDASRGDCSGHIGMFSSSMSPQERAKLTDWQKVNHEMSVWMPKLTEDITSVGVCLSPSYVDYPDEALDALQRWAKKYQIPYVRGRRDEHFGVARKPR